MGHPIARLLFADSVSVIKDCIEIVNETALKYGVSQLNILPEENRYDQDNIELDRKELKEHE